MAAIRPSWTVGILLGSIGLALGLRALVASGDNTSTDAPTSSFETERANAMRNPYADDFGPSGIDVSSYPGPLQDTYNNLFLARCQRCHTVARALNSPFLEPAGTDKAAKEKTVAEWKKKYPELFKDPHVWQPEAHIWERYVKRMMAKPGCDIGPDEGRRIWEFLTYDSVHRKMGDHEQKWLALRRKLLDDFKAEHPDRYRELYETD